VVLRCQKYPLGVATGRSLMISTRVFSHDWDWLRNEWGGNGENKLTTLGDFYYEGEKSHGIASEGFGNQRSY